MGKKKKSNLFDFFAVALGCNGILFLALFGVRAYTIGKYSYIAIAAAAVLIGFIRIVRRRIL